MEDRCVVCGEIVAEGTWVCVNCKVANSEAPCRKCNEKKEGCHVYCSKYLEYFNARKRYRDIKHKQNDEEGYFISKARRMKEIARQKGENV